MENSRVGVLGGGQLGRMLAEAAHRLNIQVSFLDAPNAPAKQINAVAEQPDGSFTQAADVLELSKQCDLLTVEIEHVETKVLEEISNREPGKVQPSWQTLRVIQDKYRQKEHLVRNEIPIARSLPLKTSSSSSSAADIAVEEVVDDLGYPFMLKSRTNAYDGRGNFPVRSESDVEPALAALKDRPLYAERWADFRMELAVMVVKTSEEVAVSMDDRWGKSTQAFPVVETVHQDSICKLTYTPARGLSKRLARQAQQMARRAVSTFAGRGVFGVEMFLLPDSSLLINEIAPRPHNSGHYTIEACHMSQYEAHLRAILPDLCDTISPGATALLTPNTNAIMLNILGGSTPSAHLVAARAAFKVPGAKVHLYGKGDGRPGRKMGHIALIASTMEEAEKKMQPLVDVVDAIRTHRSDTAASPETITETARKLSLSAKREPPSSQTPNPKSNPPLISITMGSDSDLPILKPGLSILDDFTIPYTVTITSAHRTPERMLSHARTAASRGIKVIIAAAGGAAHLPGMLASSTSLPVIGIPVKSGAGNNSALDGLDSLLSIVQMPRGVPVATVAVNNSVNAALLAVRILAVRDPPPHPSLQGIPPGRADIDGDGAESDNERPSTTTPINHTEKMDAYRREMERGVLDKADRLERVGWREY